MKYESDSDTNYNWYTRNYPECLYKRAGRVGIYSITKIG